MNNLDHRPRTRLEAEANRLFWSRVSLALLAALVVPLLHYLTSLLPASWQAQEQWADTQMEITGIHQQVQLLEKEESRAKTERDEALEKAKDHESQAAVAVQDAEKLIEEASLSTEQAAAAEGKRGERQEHVLQVLDAAIIQNILKNP